MNKIDLDGIRRRLAALPDPERKWKLCGAYKIEDVRNCPICEVTAWEHQKVADFIINSPEDIAHLLAEIERLQTEAAAMREALEAVEWEEHDEGFEYCPWCGISPGEVHLSDCQGHNALSGDAGRALLERLRNVEAELENGHKALDAANTPRGDVYGVWSVTGRIMRLRQERDEAQARLLSLAGMSVASKEER